jgi:hypothetical protein
MFSNAKIVEKRTFIELQHEEESTEAVGRVRALSDSLIRMPSLDSIDKDLYDTSTCGSTYDGLDAQSTCSGDVHELLLSEDTSSTPMSSPRMPQSPFNEDIPETPFWADSCECQGFHMMFDATPICSPRLLDNAHPRPAEMNCYCISHNGAHAQFVPVELPSVPRATVAPLLPCGLVIAHFLAPCSLQQSCESEQSTGSCNDLRSQTAQSCFVPMAKKGRCSSKTSGFKGGRSDAEAERQTTVIIRHLPKSCKLAEVLNALNAEGFQGFYDFVHVPVDFVSEMSLGYALVNFVDAAKSMLFLNNLQRIKESNAWVPHCIFSDEQCHADFSTELQGLKAQVERYRNSSVMHASVPQGYKPALFRNGWQVAFPPATQRIKAPRVRKNKVAAMTENATM